MLRLLSHLTLRDWLIVGAGRAVVLAIELGKHSPPGPAVSAAPPAPDWQPLTHGPETVAERRLGTVTDPTIRARLEQDFLPGAYYGAFATSRAGAGWVTGYANNQAAGAAAMAICGEYGEGCMVSHVLLPAGHEGYSPDSLSFQQAEMWRDIAAGSGPRAYAFSVSGASGTGTGETAADARDAALAACENAQVRHELLPDMPCRVTAVWQE